ncbi:hypothetical protein QBC47DRAFT_40985 [Echria macrotheca]|uniref:Endopeptidase Clp n=1 Tax=Echria macrotheca TaxID=438768 RepID=A0AAJ0F7H5_9PEZI|nr:hypothetical protein QBC47DRAFT_40985 [Echria macrotheca]
MRFEDWDVILLVATNDNAKPPFKEFRVACHVVSDHELFHFHGPACMPVMTCFVPSLPVGAPFQVSIHNWTIPNISQFAKDYSGHPELVKFEARVLVDGRLVAAMVFGRDINGPRLIENTVDFMNTGQSERLRFPRFHRRLLRQNRWDAADDIGRIKIIIAEVLPRDPPSVMFERLKNVVAFSFQHAPLELLEANAIAWPNPLMYWNPIQQDMLMTQPPQCYDDLPQSHAHSHWTEAATKAISRQRSCQHLTGPECILSPQQPANLLRSDLPPIFAGRELLTNLYYGGGFGGSAAHPGWMGSLAEVPYPWQCIADTGVWQQTRINRQQSSSDTTMSDYAHSYNTDAMQTSHSSLESEPMCLEIPTSSGLNISREKPASDVPSSSVFAIASNQGTSLTNSLLNQPVQPLPFSLHASLLSSTALQGAATSARSASPLAQLLVHQPRQRASSLEQLSSDVLDPVDDSVTFKLRHGTPTVNSPSVVVTSRDFGHDMDSLERGDDTCMSLKGPEYHLSDSQTDSINQAEVGGHMKT